MKDSILTIRVSDEQKLKLEGYSNENNISISKVIWNIGNRRYFKRSQLVESLIPLKSEGNEK
jgi:hypothetical protein